MAYGQQAALRVQETELFIGDSWVALEGSTALAKRFGTKIFLASQGGANRLALSYDNTVGPKQGRDYLGAGQKQVEPNTTGLTLYGRAKLAGSVNSLRVYVTEYGH